MTFFNNFPTLLYKLDTPTLKNGFVEVTDIFRRVAVKDQFIVNEIYLDTYTIKSGERPEDIAYELYDDPQLHWVILLINNIIDPYHDWYYTPEQLRSMVVQRYTNPDAIHHYASKDNLSLFVDYNAADLANGDIVAVTNLEYETLENDERQEIKILHPRYLKEFTDQFKNLIGR